jgi:hypothetical protein
MLMVILMLWIVNVDGILMSVTSVGFAADSIAIASML